MRKRLSLIFFALAGLVSLGFFLVRNANWNSQKRVIPTQDAGSTHTPLQNSSVAPPLSDDNLHSVDRSPSQEFGAISGRVMDAKGRPVANASVWAWAVRRTWVGLVPSAGTNSRGIFKFRQLEVGKYSLSVGKDYAGYAKSENRFYSAGFVENPTVLVEAGKTTWCGDVHLGPKAGRLVGTIRDSMTGNPIVSIGAGGQDRQLVLRRTEDPNNSYDPGIDINGNFEVLVPPISFTLEVVVTGYEKKNMGILNLKSGETRRLDIVLHRSSAHTSGNF